MKFMKLITACLGLLVAATTLSGCLIVAEDGGECYDDCYDYEVCETYCDAWSCWDECWYETSCETFCEDTSTYTETEVIIDNGADCYNNFDCADGQICIANTCKPRDTEDRGLAGLCQVCESDADCSEDNALCIRLNFDQASRTGESVCTRTCEYNHECPAGFECIRVSQENGTPAQCLPVITDFGKRTCNSSPELECVRATDCELGESCVNNSCVGPNDAECDSNNACANGQECRNFECVDANAPECATRTDCNSGENCIDGSCVAAAESCVFNEECDGGMCVDGTCLSTCDSDSECASGEQCRAGLCEPFGCRRSADCAAGDICVNAQCESTCNAETKEGCDAGYICNTFGYCDADPNVDCRTNAECARDEICNAGACQTACSCNQQCGTGEVCNLDSGTCEAPAANVATCENDCDCPSGQACNAGQCG